MYTKLVEVAIIGAGPGGMQCGIYTASEGLDTLILEREAVGGQIRQTPKLENFAGQNHSGVTGQDFVANMRQQAEAMGCAFEAASVGRIAWGRKRERIWLGLVDSKGNIIGRVGAMCVVCATGSRWRKLGNVPSEIVGKMLHYGPYRAMSAPAGKRYMVVGGGNSSGQAIIELANKAERVDVVIRSNMKMSRYLENRIKASSNVKLYEDCTVDHIEPNSTGCMVHVQFKNAAHQHKFSSDEVLYCAGQLPNTEFLRGDGIKLDSNGFIVTGKNSNLSHESSMNGVFALGDCRSGVARRSVGNAIGDGSTVASQIHQFLDSGRAPTSVS